MGRLLLRWWWLVAVGVGILALWLVDGERALVVDVRWHLLADLVPLANRYGLSSALLPWLLYPMVAANIALPVLLLGFFRHRRRLLGVLAGDPILPLPWPQIRDRRLHDGFEHIEIVASRTAAPVLWWLAALLIVACLAAALWGRDAARAQMVSDVWGIRLTVLLEMLIIVISARLLWFVGRALALAALYHGTAQTTAAQTPARYVGEGWLLSGLFDDQQGHERVLLGRRVVALPTEHQPSLARSLARGMADIFR